MTEGGNILPQKKMAAKLIVLVAFDPDDDGAMQPVYGPAEQPSEERAIRTAKVLAQKHAAVLAWSRDANPTIGEYGEPTELFRHGDVPDME